jgi:hypothetical protein
MDEVRETTGHLSRDGNSKALGRECRQDRWGQEDRKGRGWEEFETQL